MTDPHAPDNHDHAGALGPVGAMAGDYGAVLWQWLDRASERWAQLDMTDLTATQSSTFTRLILSGQLQLRQQVTARGSGSDPVAQATFIVTGDYRQALLRALRGTVPEFGDRVVVQPPSKVEYRLSVAGLDTQADIRASGRGEIEEAFLAESLQFVVPGVVNITDLRYDKPVTAADLQQLAPTDDKVDTRTRNAPAWPASKTDGYVAAYHAARKRDYITLARDVLDERAGAIGEFRIRFGPTAIAKAITARAGSEAQRACRAQDVLKTHTYRSLIQPLMQKPPRKPPGWERMLDGRPGDDLPEVLADIPFEDEDR